MTIQVWNRPFSHTWLKAMTPVTIRSGFRLAGVYPFNRNAITVPGTEKDLLSTPTAKLAYRHGPFHSPRPLGQAPNQKPSHHLQFSEEEHQLFLRRQEEGYDISDCRYDQWLRQQTSATPITPVTPPSCQTSDVISESFPSSLVDYCSTPKVQYFQRAVSLCGVNSCQCPVWLTRPNRNLQDEPEF